MYGNISKYEKEKKKNSNDKKKNSNSELLTDFKILIICCFSFGSSLKKQVLEIDI